MDYSVSRIPADGGGCGWYEILPPPPPPRIVDEDLETDWLIIGAGFAGLSAAHRIQQHLPADTVTVVDAQRVAWGASGRNSGFMIDLPHNLQSEDYRGENQNELDQIRRNRFAIQYARSMIDQFGLADVMSTVGRINAATDKAGLSALSNYAAHLENLGESFKRLSQDDLKNIIGTDYYQGGIHMPGCLLVQPAAFIRGIADGLSNCGVQIYENSPVTGFSDATNSESGLFTVLTPNGRILARKLILTVNGHLQSFGLYKRQLMHIFLYGSMTRELTQSEQGQLGGESEWGLTPAHPMGSTVRRIKEGRICVRNHITYNPERQTSIKQLKKAERRQKKSFANRFPMLPKVDMAFSWSGHLCLSRNSVSVFGEIEKNVFAACCHNGLGATHGTLNGVLIADYAMKSSEHATKPLIEDALNAAQPLRLFPEPLMSVGAKTYLWWGQISAGRDI